MGRTSVFRLSVGLLTGAVLLLPALRPTIARADVQVVAIGGDPAVRSEVRALAVAGARDAMERSGVAPGPLHADACLAEPVEDCAARLLTGAFDVLLAVSVWGTSTEITGISVTVFAKNGDTFAARAETSRAALGTAARDVALEAWAKRARGRGPFLRVRSTPEAAFVELDGREVGLTPYRGVLRPGRHRVRVHMDGRRAVERTVSAPLDDDDAEVVVEVQLAANDARAPSEHGEHGGERHSSRAILGPLVLGVVGLGLIAVDVAALASTGETSRATEDALNVPAFVTYGILGLGALASGLLWFLFTGGDDTPPATVSLDLQPNSFGASARLSF